MKFSKGFIITLTILTLSGCIKKEISGNLRVYSDYTFSSKRGSQYLRHGDYDGTVIIKKGELSLKLDFVTKSGFFIDEHAEINTQLPYYQTWLKFDGEHKRFAATDLKANFHLDVYLNKNQIIEHVSTTQNCTITKTKYVSDFYAEPAHSTNYIEVNNTEYAQEKGIQTLDYDKVNNYEDYNIGFINPSDGAYVAEFHGVSHESHKINTVLGACVKQVEFIPPQISITPTVTREKHIYIFR